jgi:PAS domain S-box-containing protein
MGKEVIKISKNTRISELENKIYELNSKLQEAQDTIEAIRTGQVDAIVTSDIGGERVYTLKGEDYPYRAMVENMNEGAATISIDGTIFYINNRFAEMVGVPLEKLISTSIFEYINPSDQSKFSTLISEAKKSNVKAELELKLKDGSKIPVLISPHFLKDSPNDIISMVITDLTVYKENEEIMKSERLANSIIEQVDDYIIVCDRNGRIIKNSIKANSLTDENPFFQVFDNIFNFVLEKGNLTFSVGEVLKGKTFNDVQVVLKRNEKDKIFLLNATTLLDSKENIIGCLISLAEITNLKMIEEILKLRTRDLIASNKELEAFSYSVSHDLRTPLRSIDGYSKILNDEYSGKLDNTASEYLNNIRKSSTKIALLLDDMQRLFKITSSEFKPQKCDLSFMVKSIRESLIKSQPDTNVEFLIKENITANCDENLIRIALTNLIENAWKFTIKNKNAKVEFGVKKINGVDTYFIKDNGIGFDMRYVDKIFEPFSRLYNNKDIPGTGIGLSIVDRIIKKHNGSIWAESSPGIGTTFYFALNT